MKNLRTVSDTKRSFYTIHTRPVNSIYRRVVEELMVEMHLLRVNEDFKEDPIFALGVITTYDRFMETYTPEKDQVAIFEAICRAQEADPKNYRKEAERLKTFVASKSFDELMAWLTDSTESGGDDLQGQIHNIAQNEKFKYSRLFGIGLLASLEIADAEILKDEGRLKEALHTISEALKLPENKMMQDVEVYRANLEKMVQTQQAIADNIAADRKRREQAAVEKAEAEKKAKTAAAEGTSEEKSDKAGASDAAADTSSPS
ncbi:MAG: photosystem II biogenesis protein Psp29 [Thermosynechococcaceae cyanobacterium]